MISWRAFARAYLVCLWIIIALEVYSICSFLIKYGETYKTPKEEGIMVHAPPSSLGVLKMLRLFCIRQLQNAHLWNFWKYVVLGFYGFLLYILAFLAAAIITRHPDPVFGRIRVRSRLHVQVLEVVRITLPGSSSPVRVLTLRTLRYNVIQRI